jgi:hypothetical protein
MLEIPFYAFWILLFWGRRELGAKGIAIAIAVWAGTHLIVPLTGIQPALGVTAQALIDVVLVLIVFKGDVRIG